MPNSVQKIIVLTTGGTIEKTYDEFDGSLSNRETIIKQRILERLRLPYTEIEVHALMCKDSLDMTEDDRSTIFKAIGVYARHGHPIMVLHGTDTMEHTARYCYTQQALPLVPIIFTGAMKPMGFEDSDAKQNVVESLYAAKIVDPGWYISFHSTLFKVPNVKKNKARRTFKRT
jgi:L-asparaginase